MEMQKYCWLQVIVSFLYSSFSLVTIHKIVHGLIWANIRKQIFSKHNLPPHLSVHLLASIILFLLCKEFCLLGSKLFEISQINSKKKKKEPSRLSEVQLFPRLHSRQPSPIAQGFCLLLEVGELSSLPSTKELAHLCPAWRSGSPGVWGGPRSPTVLL